MLFKNWDTRHTIGAVCALFALASLVLAFVAKDTGPLFHITAGTFGIVSLTLFAYARQLGVDIPPPPVAAAPLRVPPLPVLFLVAALALLSAGCLSSAPLVPVTPANQAQIATCQNTATEHNIFVIGDFALSGGTAGVAAAASIAQDQNAKNALSITGIGLGGALAIGTAVAELSASNFTNSRCTDVVGALPTAKNPESAPGAGH